MKNVIGENIKFFRKQKALSQDELAEKLFVTHQAVSKWETGKSQPDIDTLKKITEVLEVPLEAIIYERDEKNPISKTVENRHVKNGVTFGSVLACVISYVNWGSIWWAILHGILGWIYVIYYAIKY